MLRRRESSATVEAWDRNRKALVEAHKRKDQEAMRLLSQQRQELKKERQCEARKPKPCVVCKRWTRGVRCWMHELARRRAAKAVAAVAIVAAGCVHDPPTRALPPMPLLQRTNVPNQALPVGGHVPTNAYSVPFVYPSSINPSNYFWALFTSLDRGSNWTLVIPNATGELVVTNEHPSAWFKLIGRSDSW